MIPKVKTWQVKFWTEQNSRWHGRVLKARVQTINKRFAKWLANEYLGYPAIFSHKVTVGVLTNSRGRWYTPIPVEPDTCEKCGAMAENETPVCRAHGAYTDY